MGDEKKQLEKILSGHSPEVVSLVSALRDLVQSAAPELTEEVKTGWGNITYKRNGVVCAISPHKAHVNLHFYKGTQMEDPEGLLDGSGKKLRHVKVVPSMGIPEKAIIYLVQEAIRIDSKK